MQVTRASAVGALLLGIGLLVGGCVSLPWQPTAGLYSSPAENFAVELPQGWMRLNSNEDLLITRDGILLQHEVRRLALFELAAGATRARRGRRCECCTGEQQSGECRVPACHRERPRSRPRECSRARVQ